MENILNTKTQYYLKRNYFSIYVCLLIFYHYQINKKQKKNQTNKRTKNPRKQNRTPRNQYVFTLFHEKNLFFRTNVYFSGERGHLLIILNFKKSGIFWNRNCLQYWNGTLNNVYKRFIKLASLNKAWFEPALFYFLQYNIPVLLCDIVYLV